jgi:hypothetical protein
MSFICDLHTGHDELVGGFDSNHAERSDPVKFWCTLESAKLDTGATVARQSPKRTAEKVSELM